MMAGFPLVGLRKSFVSVGYISVLICTGGVHARKSFVSGAHISVLICSGHGIRRHRKALQ